MNATQTRLEFKAVAALVDLSHRETVLYKQWQDAFKVALKIQKKQGDEWLEARR